GNVPLNEGRAVFRLRIDAGVGELPVRGALPVVFRLDAVAVGFCLRGGGGRAEGSQGPRAGEALEQVTAIEVRHGGGPRGRTAIGVSPQGNAARGGKEGGEPDFQVTNREEG